MVKLTDEDTQILLSDNSQHIRKTRIDMNYLTLIINGLMKLPSIKNHVKLFPNNTLYNIDNSYRYAQYVIRNNTRYYELTSIEKTGYLNSVLAQAENGATSTKLCNFLINSEDVTFDEAEDFISSLIEAQLLISEIEPSVTGNEPLDNLIIQLEKLGEENLDILEKLKCVQSIASGTNKGIERYILIEQELTKLDLDVAIPNNTIQTDLFLNLKSGRINKQSIERLIKQHEDLYVLTRRYDNQVLEEFKSKFLARYEEQEVPLLLALDAEAGIGYAESNQSTIGDNPTITGLVGQAIARQKTVRFDEIQWYVHSKYLDYLSENKSIIEISEKELSALNKSDAPKGLASSFYLFGSLLNDTKDDQEKLVFDITGFGGPSGGNLLARFTHGDKQICEFTKEY